MWQWYVIRSDCTYSLCQKNQLVGYRPHAILNLSQGPITEHAGQESEISQPWVKCIITSAVYICSSAVKHEWARSSQCISQDDVINNEEDCGNLQSCSRPRTFDQRACFSIHVHRVINFHHVIMSGCTPPTRTDHVMWLGEAQHLNLSSVTNKSTVAILDRKLFVI